MRSKQTSSTADCSHWNGCGRTAPPVLVAQLFALLESVHSCTPKSFPLRCHSSLAKRDNAVRSVAIGLRLLYPQAPRIIWTYVFPQNTGIRAISPDRVGLK